jgi:hypothetical protein
MKGSFDKHANNHNTFQVASVDNFDDVGEYYLRTYIRYDEMNVKIIRNNYTWLAWIATLGGI